MSRLLRTLQIRATATVHKCAECNKIIPFGRKMMVAVMTTRNSIHNDYYCMRCAKKHKDMFEEVK